MKWLGLILGFLWSVISSAFIAVFFGGLVFLLISLVVMFELTFGRHGFSFFMISQFDRAYFNRSIIQGMWFLRILIWTVALLHDFGYQIPYLNNIGSVVPELCVPSAFVVFIMLVIFLFNSDDSKPVSRRVTRQTRIDQAKYGQLDYYLLYLDLIITTVFWLEAVQFQRYSLFGLAISSTAISFLSIYQAARLANS